MRSRLTVVILFFALGCRASTGGTKPESLLHDQGPAALPPKLPSLGGSGELSPWGGTDPSQWRAEAIVANAVSAELNRSWIDSSIADVLVAMPIRLFPSSFFPYGDGQSNANPSFESWKVKRPPLIATLIRKTDGSVRVVFRFDSEWRAAAQGFKKVEVRFRDQNGSNGQVILDATIEGSGALLATWNNPPATLGWSGTTGKGVALVRPSPNFGDFFPISFQIPVRKTSALVKSVKTQLGQSKPQTFRDFLDRTLVPDRSSLKLSAADKTFFQNLRFINGDIKARIDELMGLHKADNAGISDAELKKIRTKYENMATDGRPSVLKKAIFLVDLPNIYNTKRGQLPFMPLNIHGDYPLPSFHITTGVGMGWTWVAEEDTPFKIMYTCFERRQAAEETAVNTGLPTDEQRNFGRTVASGGGWHRIGDNQETIINSVEEGPAAVASGFSIPSERAGLGMPTGSNYVHGLRDIVVARWLFPGEAFVTLRFGDKGDTGEGKSSNYHWYFFHQNTEVCTEEWVHNFGDPNTPNFLSEP